MTTRRVFEIGVDVLTVLMVVAAAPLLWQRLSADPAVATTRTEGLGGLEKGSVLPTFEVRDANGATRTYGTETGAHLFYFFRTDCPACAAQRPLWDSIARTASGAGVRVAAVTGEELAQWVTEYFGDAPVFVEQSTHPGEDFPRLRTAAVPATLLVDGEGRVVRHYVGRLADGADIERALADLN